MEPTVAITNEVLERLDDDYNDYSFIQIKDLAVQDGRVIITSEDSTEKRSLMMEPDAQKYLGEFVGLPLNYISKIDDPQIAAMLWNYHIGKRGSDIDVLKAVAVGDTLKSFTLRSFQPLRPSDVVNACRLAMADCEFERMPSVWNKHVNFALTGPDLYEEFASTLGLMSDIHHFSVGVEFNFAGGDSPSMTAFGNRHHCGNQMSSPYGIGGKQFRIFTTEPAQMLAKFTDATRKGVEFIRSIFIPKIRATMQAQIPEMANEIAELSKKYGLTERVEALVFEAYRTEDLGGTTYHLVNALTRAANSERCPPDMISKLHQIAGEVTVSHDPASPPKRCGECHQKIKKPLSSRSKAEVEESH